MVTVAERHWLHALAQTAGLRLCVLPLSAAAAMISAGLIMQHASVAAFGLITLVGQLQLALPFADLGLGAAVARVVARSSHGPAERLAAAGLIRKTSLLLCGIAALGVIGAVALGLRGTYSQIFQAPAVLAPDVDVVMSVALSMFFLGLPLSVSERILIGQDRASLLVVLGLIPALCNLSVVGIVIGLDLRPMWLALGLPVGYAAFSLITGRSVHLVRWWREGSQAAAAAAAPSLRHILIAGLPVVATVAGVVLAEQHGRFVLATISSPEALSEYALALYLYMPAYSVMYMAATVLWPRFARGGDMRMWRLANASLIGLGAAAALGYLVFARPLSGLISSGDLVLSWPVVGCMSAVFIAQSAHLTQANLLTDAAGFRRQAIMACSLLTCAVALSVLGVRLGLGAAAPAAAMALAVLLAQIIPGMLLARRRLLLAPQQSASVISHVSTTSPRRRHTVLTSGEHHHA